MAAELPSRPDPETGEPRPPTGPRIFGSYRLSAHYKTAGGHGVPPSGRGPILEAQGVALRYRLAAAGVLMAALIFIITSDEDGWSWVEDPAVWTIILVTGVAIVAMDWSNTELVAGADWFRVERRRWVDTYDIVQISLTRIFRGWTVHLTDSSGRRVRASLKRLEENPDLWALVYNGMLHSARNGARVDNLAAGILRLRPGFERLRSEARPSSIRNRTVWIFLFVLVMAFGVIWLYRPELLGLVLGVLGIVVVIALIGALAFAGYVQHRDRLINELDPEDLQS